MSLYGVLGYAAINEAQQRISDLRSQESSSSEFSSDLDQRQIDFESLDPTDLSEIF